MTHTNGITNLNRRDELKAFLARAIEEPVGLGLTVDGAQVNMRSLAIAGLQAAKKEMVEADKRYLDLVIRPQPFTKNEIAIYKMEQPLEDE